MKGAPVSHSQSRPCMRVGASDPAGTQALLGSAFDPAWPEWPSTPKDPHFTSDTTALQIYLTLVLAWGICTQFDFCSL